MGDIGIGYAAVLVATLFFGSNFVPVKRYETHDGMYYQWVMCAAIWLTGLLIQLFLFVMPPDVDGSWIASANGTRVWNASATTGRPDAYSVKFMPMSALGGVLWATGNTLSVPVINSIGLSLGLLIWGSANMLMGWASGVFGLFTGHKDMLNNPVENYVGVALAVLALTLYTQVKTGEAAETKPCTSGSNTPPHVIGFVNEAPDAVLLGSANHATCETASAAGTPARANSKAVGVLMAIVAGVLFGNTFTPPNFLIFNHLGPADPLDHIFSHYTGIFAASSLWFICYCACMRGSPLINPRITIPGMISGCMWAVAQTCWFVANDALSVAVAFPIITSGPGIVSALWGVFVFGEVRGYRNYCVLFVAITLALAGCVLIGLSK